MGYWTKYFADGTESRGTDAAIAAHMASWSKGRLDSMVAVDLEHDGYLMKIYGPGSFWQSDTYEALFPGPKAVLIKRRIERRIELRDTHFYYAKGHLQTFISFNTNDLTVGGQFVVVESEWLGLWLILEYDLRSKTAQYYIRGNRI